MENIHVLIPSVTNKPIVSEIIRTFGGEAKIKVYHLTDIVVNNYASEALISDLKNQIESAIDKWYDNSYKDDDHVYVVLTGGILQSVIAITHLDKLDIDYKFLVYERKVKKYVCLTRNADIDTDFLMEYIYNKQ